MTTTEQVKHTPGPWAIWDGPAFVGGGADLCIGAGDTWLANMDHRTSKCEQKQRDGYHKHLESGDCDICSAGEEAINAEQFANARLIAASPDLLAAAIMVASLLDEHDRGQAELMAAIAAATGATP